MICYFKNALLVIIGQSSLFQDCHECTLWQVFLSVNRHNNRFLIYRVVIDMMTAIGATKHVTISLQYFNQVYGRIIQCSERFREYSRVMLSSGISWPVCLSSVM